MKIGLILIASLFLHACTNVAMSGAQVVYNHHNIQKNISDQYTTVQAYEALNKQDDQFKNANISIATYNGEVLLAGQVPDVWQRYRIEQIVKTIPDVEEVHNLITVSSPSSALTRLSDIWITTKIKTKLIISNDLDATKIKVVTENGTVYLMGVILPSEAQAATDIAKETDGVSRVVKIFKYLRISKI